MFIVAVSLAEIDWTNAVKIPLVMDVTIGLLLSIYTGLIASRIFAFFQVRAKAVTWIFELGAFFGEEYPSPHDFSIKLGQATFGIMLEMRGLGHERAKHKIGNMFKAYLRRCAELVRVPIPNSDLPEFPQQNEISGLIWCSCMANLRGFYREQLGANAASIAALKPNGWALITPRPFPNYMSEKGDSIGLLVYRQSWWHKLVCDGGKKKDIWNGKIR